MTVAVIPIPGLPMIRPGDDLALLLGDAIDAARVGVKADVLTLLPRDADASAAALCERLRQRFGVELAVVVTDTFGRPWREGLVEVALGCAGMDPLLDLRGRADLAGRALHHTVVALADEVAAAAGLVMEKDSAVAAAIVRGVRFTAGPGGAAAR